MNHPKKELITTVLALVACFFAAGAREKLPYWKDVEIVGVNKVAPRTTFMSYDNVKDASSFLYENSRYYYLLNGI